jgi:hypothetical protein
MKRLTTQELEAIRKRAEQATEGPWYTAHTADERLIVNKDGGIFSGEYSRLNDADFIANARTDIPKLLAEVERLQAESNGYRSALLEIVDGEVDSLGDAFRVAKGAITDEQLG